MLKFGLMQDFRNPRQWRATTSLELFAKEIMPAFRSTSPARHVITAKLDNSAPERE